MTEFQVTTTTVHTFREGWGVAVIPLWSFRDEDNETISDLDVEVVPIREDLVIVSYGTPCVPSSTPKMLYPIANFRELDDLWQDDSHDARDRWFATEQEAREHAESVIKSWENPNPWQSFVVTE